MFSHPLCGLPQRRGGKRIVVGVSWRSASVLKNLDVASGPGCTLIRPQALGARPVSAAIPNAFYPLRLLRRHLP